MPLFYIFTSLQTVYGEIYDEIALDFGGKRGFSCGLECLMRLLCCRRFFKRVVLMMQDILCLFRTRYVQAIEAIGIAPADDFCPFGAHRAQR